MSTKPTVLLFLVLTFIGLWPTSVLAQQSGPKKLIYHGWGSPDTQYVRNYWRQMEEMPFDGVGIVVPIDRRIWQQGQRRTRNQLGWQVMGKRPFRVEEFREAIEDLKTAKWRKFTENFLPVIFSAEVSTAGLSWFDDTRWSIITNNFAVVARIATEVGLRGLMLDPEHYSYALFNYEDQRRQRDRSFETYKAIARQRGREVMTAIAGPMPKAVLLSLYAYSLPLMYLQHSGGLAETHYNLLPAFYDGFLEAMSPQTKLIDGYEQAYAFKEQSQFEGARRGIQAAVELSALPHDYRQKVKTGFGLWLDYRKQKNYFTPDEFQRAVSSALKVSDEYVWIYSEGVGFFPVSGVEPSYIKALAAARNDMNR